MAATMKQIREGLATALDTVPDMQASAYMLAEPVLPSAYVMPLQLNYHQAMGTVSAALSEQVFAVRVLVAAGTDQGGQLALDELVSSGVIPAALEVDKTLGGVVQSLIVDGMTAYEAVVVGENTPAFRAEWSVRIFV